jgi:hypothetical protein
MKRREFIVASTGSVIGGALSPLDLLQAAPCPPSTLSVAGGNAVNTSCGGAYAWTAIGPNGLFDKRSYTTQAGHTVFVRANMWNPGESGYNPNWLMEVNSPQDWRVESKFVNGGGTPKGYPNNVRGWSRGEQATNTAMGGLGIKLSNLTKAKIHATCYMGNNTEANYRNLLLHDLYLHSIQNPGYNEGAAAANKATHNILYYQRSVDPRGITYFGAQCRDGFSVTVGGDEYRISVDGTPFYSSRADITVFAGPFDFDGNGLPQNWGSDSRTLDFKALLEVLRVHPNTSAYFADFNDLYLTSMQTGFEPIQTSSVTGAKYGISNWWTAVQSETDGLL